MIIYLKKNNYLKLNINLFASWFTKFVEILRIGGMTII